MKGDGEFEYVMRRVSRGCWVWTGRVTPEGYGRYYFGGQFKFAHRVVYELFVGPIPEGMQLLHSCDNRACVNPNHLRVGTAAENATDRTVRGRQGAQPALDRRPRGHRHGRAVLTPEVVAEARSAFLGGASIQEIARHQGRRLQHHARRSSQRPLPRPRL